MQRHANDIQLAAVIPVLDEEDVLWANAQSLADLFDSAVGQGQWQFIFVDNGSRDSTPRILDRICARWQPSFSVYEQEHNYGKALRAGLAAARTPWVHTIDIEQWDDPFFRWSWRNRERYDLFIGSKRAEPALNHQSRDRKLLSWGLNALIRTFFGYDGSDTHGPKLLRMAAMRPILQDCRLSWGQFDSEFVIRARRAGLSLVETPVVYVEQRPSRKSLIEKIVRNLWEFNRLRRLLRGSAFDRTVRLHRFSRDRILAENEAADTDPVGCLPRH